MDSTPAEMARSTSTAGRHLSARVQAPMSRELEDDKHGHVSTGHLNEHLLISWVRADWLRAEPVQPGLRATDLHAGGQGPWQGRVSAQMSVPECIPEMPASADTVMAGTRWSCRICGPTRPAPSARTHVGLELLCLRAARMWEPAINPLPRLGSQHLEESSAQIGEQDAGTNASWVDAWSARRLQLL